MSVNFGKIYTMGVFGKSGSAQSKIGYRDLVDIVSKKVRSPKLYRSDIISPLQVTMNIRPKLSDEEAVFFFKPSVLAGSSNVEAALKLGFGAIAENNWEILSVSAFSGHYLKDTGTIVRHYGMINKIASEGISAVTTEGKDKFYKLFGVSVDKKDEKGDPIVYGAFHLMKKFNMSTSQLTEQYYKKPDFKIAAGTYVGTIDINGKSVYVLNGFNPGQIEDYTKPKDRIVILHIRKGQKGTPLKKMREDVIGPTNPAKGKGIRNILYTHKAKFGVKTVNMNWNGFHFSAGNIEAAAELFNFFNVPLENAFIGKLLKEHASYSNDEIRMLTENPLVKWKEAIKPVFDHTELLPSRTVIEFARTIKGQLQVYLIGP